MPHDPSVTKTNSTKTGMKSSTKPKKKPSTLKSKQTTNTQQSLPAYLLDGNDIQFTMTHAMDHDDGSATYNLDLNPYTNGKLVEIGVIALLKEHIAQEKAKKPSLWAKIKRFLHK